MSTTTFVTVHRPYLCLLDQRISGKDLTNAAALGSSFSTSTKAFLGGGGGGLQFSMNE